MTARPSPPTASDHPARNATRLVAAPVVAMVLTAGFAWAAEIFVDRAAASGLVFTHTNGMVGTYSIAEVTGQGIGLVDVDNDGDLDAYLVQGRQLGADPRRAVFPWTAGEPPRDRLFRNDLVVAADGSRRLHFTDVTDAAGLGCQEYGMGIAAGDFDNDGWVDLYVANLGPNRLYRNRGDGTFVDVTAAAGVDDPHFSTNAAFVDFDRDGDLDLYVANYVDWAAAPDRVCYAASSARDFCGPDAYDPVGDRLFANRGDGTFADVTVAAGIAAEKAAGFAVVAADLNGDGWVDLYVANDGDPNFLWVNQKNGTFVNDALWAGAAVNCAGRAEASMGVDAGDVDGDGDDDLFMTHISVETNTLFVNDGRGLFTDCTARAGLAAPSRGLTGFGTAFVDYDNDGWLDLLVANGAVQTIPALAAAGDRFPLGQPNLLLANDGRGSFTVVADAGATFPLLEVSRGIAVGDIDNDGDSDVLLATNNGPARLLVNQVGSTHRWVGLRLVVASGRRDALGARVEVRTARRSLWRRVRADGSFCSASDPRVLVGLGADESPLAITVVWPSGQRETWGPLPISRYTTLVQGAAPVATTGS